MEMKTLLLITRGLTGTTVSKAVKAGWKRLPRRLLPQLLVGGLALSIFAAIAANAVNASVADDRKTVAALDTQYQAAVKANDAATMDRILADDFVLVTGSGKTYTKVDLLDEARGGWMHYEHQEDTDQTVHVWGNTAVITAKLWEKGTDDGKPFDYMLWFSDIYVRTPNGWRYVFGQASLPLPKTSCDESSSQLHGLVTPPCFLHVERAAANGGAVCVLRVEGL
jgi:ketosteroid isomerase-like protein